MALDIKEEISLRTFVETLTTLSLVIESYANENDCAATFATLIADFMKMNGLIERREEVYEAIPTITDNEATVPMFKSSMEIYDQVMAKEGAQNEKKN